MLNLRVIRERARDDQGFSLIELLVVIGIMGIVGSIVMAATIQGLHASRTTQARVAALSDLTLGLERIGRELRAADPLDLTVITDIDQADERVSSWINRDGRAWHYLYYLAIGSDGVPELREDLDVFELDGTLNTTLSHDSVFIVKTINVDAGIPLVTYLAADGTSLDCTSPTVLTVEECRALLATATHLRLTLVRSLDEGQPVTAQTLVTIRYTRYS